MRGGQSSIYAKCGGPQRSALPAWRISWVGVQSKRIPQCHGELWSIQMCHAQRIARSIGLERAIVGLLLTFQAGLLAFSATCHSPTDLEPAFLVSGISHWQGMGYGLYRVNPPLVRLVAAMPVLGAGCTTNWARYDDRPGSRAEFLVEQDFVRDNGQACIPLFFYARWACIPFSIAGAYFAWRWAREVYGRNAGIATVFLYVFEPNLLAHGELITPDAAATALGIVAGYSFWRWLRQPSWTRTLIVGGALGLAELTKMSWLILYVVWPALWSIWRLMDLYAGSHWRSDGPLLEIRDSPVGQSSCQMTSSISFGGPSPSFWQLVAIIAVSLYVINLGYAFDGVGVRLGDFDFVSRVLTGADDRDVVGNRFRDSWVSDVPILLPRQYVLGLDAQKKDLEQFHLPSYLCGETKQHGGWWYYYVVGLLVKVPCGIWGLLIFVIFVRLTRRARIASLPDELVILTPALVLFIVVSSHTEINRHLRYVFPSLGMCLIVLGQAGTQVARRSWLRGVVVIALVAESVVGTILAYPHHLAYFNAFVGGSKNGHRYMTGSNLDWGQDLLYLRDRVVTTGEVVSEFRGSYLKSGLIRAVIPDAGSIAGSDSRIIVTSPNAVELGIPFPPEGTMLTPTCWIGEASPMSVEELPEGGRPKRDSVHNNAP